jgi:hypothetical protein
VPPIPTPTIRLVNHLLAGMEREGFLFRVLDSLFDARDTAGLTLILMTVGMLLYGATRMVQARHRAEAGALLTSGPFAAVPRQQCLIQERVQSQVARQALWDEARALIRAWFQETAGIPPADWDRTPVREPPTADIAGGWWQRRRLRREIERLGQFAGHRIPTPLTSAELVRLTQRLHALSDAVRVGRLAFPDCSAGRNS